MRAFDVAEIALGLLPTSLRRPVLFAIVRSALSVLQAQHDRLDTSHNGEPWGTLYRLRHTGQVCSLESLLNDRFDPEERRITINRDTAGGGSPYIYSDSETRLQGWLVRWLGTMPLGETQSTGRSDGEFVVRVPSELREQEAGLRASLDDMKVAGTRYAILYI